MFDLSKVRPDPGNLSGILLVKARERSAGKYHFMHIYIDLEQMLDVRREMKGKFKRGLPGEESIDYIIARHDGLDGYDLGLVESEEDFERELRAVKEGYFLEYNRQGFETGKTVNDMPPEDSAAILYGLSVNLLKAIKLNNPIAQLMAEDSLKAFAPGKIFKAPLAEIIRMASSTIPKREELICYQCHLISAVADDNIELASRLHKIYNHNMQNSTV